MKEHMYVVRNDSNQYYNVDDMGNGILTFSAGEIYHLLNTARAICNKLNFNRPGSTFKVYEVKLELVP